MIKLFLNKYKYILNNKDKIGNNNNEKTNK